MMLRKAVLILALSIVSSVEATSIYKCIGENGRTEFSQSPCSDSAEHLIIDVPKIGTAGSTNARKVVDDIEKSNRLREIDRETKKLEKEISNYQKEMDSEIRRLRNKKQYAANNLAGATWEESISTEMSAIVASIKTKIDAAREKIKSLKDEKERNATK
ncbi:MAG: DUF4124 domain-containing protein [Pseudomonadales bacterium]|nr:DUF4124 domain-containing protein [Pseudomonadales bacterium]